MLLVILMFILAPVAALGQAIDAILARQYFDEAEAACHADSGKLWGVSLCGPMLFADSKTRALVANRADRDGQLTRAGEVFVGRLPEKENISNSALDWSGVRWTMVMWPLPHDPSQRRQLMLHELFHRIQDSIGLPASSPANNHLDSTQGRLWLQLEWRALERALAAQGDARRQAVEDALVFRAYRRSLFPKASGEERSLEMHEGLSEYTGVKLSGRPHTEMHRKLAEQMEETRHVPTFVRSFAYASGPAYGILLDDTGAAWRSGLKPGNDLGALLAGTMQIQTSVNGSELKVQAEGRMRRYGGDQIQAEEAARAERLNKILSEYRARLVEGPVLIIPLRKMNVQFDPNNLQPLEGLGTVYPNIRVSDEWGTLTVSSGALLSNDWTKITVPAPREADQTTGEGWQLKLQPGWKLAPGVRKGDYTLVRDSRASNMRLRSEPHL